VLTAVFPLVDTAADAALGSVGTRTIDPGRAAAWTAVELSLGGEDEHTTLGSCTGIPITKLKIPMN